MKKNIFLIAFCTLLAVPGAQAQFDETNNLFYHTLRTPQSTLLNPAFFPTNNTFYIMLPGVDFQFGSPLALNDVIYYDRPNERTVIDINHILKSLNDNNTFRLGADVSILGFGFKLQNTFINFNTRLVNNVSLGLPISTINAVLEGNIGDNNTPRPVIELVNGDILNVTSYLETGLGASHYFEPLHLTVGLRAKFLYGIANVQTDNTKIVFNTDSNLDSVSASIFYQIQSATCAPYDSTGLHIDVGDLLKIGQANSGVSFDIGAKYDFGPFTFSVAINDLSAGIHWKKNVTTWEPSGGQGVITFNGLDVNTMLDNGTFNVDSLTQYLRDQISDMTPHRIDNGEYWFSIPTKINLGASYSFAKIFRAGLLFHGQLDRGLFCKTPSLQSGIGSNVSNTFRWNTTLSLDANLFNWAEVVVGNSLVYDGSSLDVFNPGIGLVLTPATIFQVYLMADYLSSFYLTDSKALNVKFGINLLFGKGGRTVVTEVESEE